MDREREFHDAWAASADLTEPLVRAAFESFTAPENRFILQKMGDLRGRRVLDLGSGLGESALYFALCGAEVTATDISPEMCRTCQRMAQKLGVKVDTVATPIEALEVPEGTFDLAFGANLVHHLPDHAGAFRAVARALRPGGRAFFWDPLAYNPAIWVYRFIATQVRTEDEFPLTFGVLDQLREVFDDVGHREFWLTTMALFGKYYLLDRLNPNEVRYWKRILEEDERTTGRWFRPLQRLDSRLLRLPGLRRLAWNMVYWGTKR